MVVMNASSVARCIFEGNNASYNGGGIFNGGGSDVGSTLPLQEQLAEKGGVFNIEFSAHHRLRLRVECRPLRRRRHLQRQLFGAAMIRTAGSP